MSVLIKGMNMPENCIKCPMQFGGMCYVMPAEVDESRVAPTVEEAWKQGKPDWCPLVEVPEPHGRLIDGDALDTRVRQAGGMGNVEEECTEDFNDGVLFVLDYFVKNAPTVIPREEGKNHADD